MPETLAIIPARGNSKGVAGKNLTLLASRPLIAHTIAAACQARRLGRIILSTDSEPIAEVARDCGAAVPFIRPAELARDDTPTIPVLVHAVQWLAEHEAYEPDYVMCLQPTSPFRAAEDIDRAIDLAEQRKADSVVSVTEPDHPPHWMRRIDDEGRLHAFIDSQLAIARRQEQPTAYALNGAIYLVRRQVLIEQQTLYTERTFAYVMPRQRSMDIEDTWDVHVADLILSNAAEHGQD